MNIQDSPLRDTVLELLGMGFTPDQIILEVHSAFKIESQDSEIHQLLTVMSSMVTGKHKEQLEEAIKLNWRNSFTADKYSRDIYRAGTSHLMIPYVDIDSTIKLLQYNIQMQNLPAIDRMCQKAINLFTLRSA